MNEHKLMKYLFFVNQTKNAPLLTKSGGA